MKRATDCYQNKRRNRRLCGCAACDRWRNAQAARVWRKRQRMLPALLQARDAVGG